MYENEIPTALNIMWENPKLGHIGLIEALVATGIPEVLAHQLAVFVPIAFCRVMLSGRIRFPRHFLKGTRTSKRDIRCRFDDEPVFQAAMLMARHLAEEGIRRDVYLLVAARSVEFQGINKMLLQGEEKIEDITLTEMLVIMKDEATDPTVNEPTSPTESQRPGTGGHADRSASVQARAKPWWRFW